MVAVAATAATEVALRAKEVTEAALLLQGMGATQEREWEKEAEQSGS